MTGTAAPIADWVTIPELTRDPFPIFERLRAEGGVHWVPSVGRFLVTSYEAVHATELDQEVFSANEAGSLQIRAMGHSMLRRDDPEHQIERKAWQPALRPGAVRRVWASAFRANAEAQLEQFRALGPGADLVRDFAAPYAAENLRQLVGLYNADQADLQRWSQTMIDATGNYADDPEVWRLGEASFDEVDVALDEMLSWHAAHPDESLISQLLRIPDYEMPLEKIRANLKMTIGGGLNEPRDALGVAAWALLRAPSQRSAVRRDAGLWGAAFEETIRWVAPIGMYSRQTTREVELAGVSLPAGARLGICILSANRDERVWERPEEFDLLREVRPHLAFGKGVHVCLGAWAARTAVAEVALPLLFEELPGLRLAGEDAAEASGWVFRGMSRLTVDWDTAARPGPAAELPAPAPRVAIVGAGPAGCFSAQAIRRAFPESPVDVFDRLPVPYGLVRYGVASDHPGTKAVARQFDRLFAAEGVRFRGNVALGADVPLSELQASYDAVVLASGVHRDAALPIPGAELARGAGALTRFLNVHPDEAVPAPLGEEVAVIGHGNVALDIVRQIVREPGGLPGSDTDDARLEHLSSRVRVIHLLGRSAPQDAKFDPVLVREIAALPGVAHVVRGVGSDEPDRTGAAAMVDARVEAVRALPTWEPRAGAETPRVRVEWWFGAEPRALEETGNRDVAVRIVCASGEQEIRVSDVITAIGFSPNEDAPIAAGAHPDGRVAPGLYTAGWLRRGPRGTIPDQRSDAQHLAQLLAEDLATGEVSVAAAGLPPRSGEVAFAGWQRIDARERAAAAPGRARRKLATRSDLLTAARESAAPLDAVPLAAAPGPRDGTADPEQLRSDQPVTILFGTESGGAELVAEDLAEFIPGATLRSLGEVLPDALDPGALHLIVCSTYGDGEVPSDARAFHAGLLAGAPGVAGLRYAMFGMGDRSYDRTYSRGSELIDEALAANGAIRIGAYGRHDAGGPDDAGELAAEWARGVLDEARASLRSAAG